MCAPRKQSINEIMQYIYDSYILQHPYKTFTHSINNIDINTATYTDRSVLFGVVVIWQMWYL